MEMWYVKFVLRPANRKMASEPQNTFHQSHSSSGVVSRLVGGVRGPDSELRCVRD